VRALIVGYGSIGRRHCENLQACGASDIVVVRPRGRPGDAPARLAFVGSVKEALQRAPDVAVVASPSAAHAEALFALLEARVPCYVEKPAVTAAADLERLSGMLAGAAGLVTMSGCNLRFLPSLERLRDAVKRGVVGKPVRASLQAGQWLPDWRPGRDYRATYSASGAQGGGVLFDLIHELDAARWLFGEFEEVRALGGKLSSLEIDAEDTACVLLGRRGGPVVAVGLDYVSRQRVRRYEIVGDEGTLTWDLAAMRLTLAKCSGTETLDALDENFDVARTYKTAMEAFVTAVRSRKAASPDLADGLASVTLALRVKRALASVN
jgi:predicted dehydrogenase